jgi:hypothetical protein
VTEDLYDDSRFLGARKFKDRWRSVARGSYQREGDKPVKVIWGNGQAGNIPEVPQQSFASRPIPATVMRLARFPFIFATDFCNMQDPMFTGPAMMQNLPILKHPHYCSKAPSTQP